jgi:hypothetical protein
MGLGNGDVHKTSTQVCALKNMIIIHMVFQKQLNGQVHIHIIL